MKKRLAILIATLVSGMCCAVEEPPELKLGFEKGQAWQGGQWIATPCRKGKTALQWSRHGQNASISYSAVPLDLSAYNTISFWLHSASGKNGTFMIIMSSPRTPDVMSYYAKKVTVDWVGWREVKLHFRSFWGARKPAGWDKITGFRFTTSGWSQEPDDESVWTLDDLTVSYDPAAFRATLTSGKYVDEPPAKQYLTRLHKAHPRLILLDEDLPRIKQYLTETEQGRKSLQRIRSRAERYYALPPRPYEIPDGLRLLAVSRNVLSRMYHFGFMYRLEGDKKWLERGWAEMASVAAFPDWNPRHYLDTAEMMHAMGIGYDWLYNGLTEEQRKVARDGIWQHGLRLSYATYMGLEAEGMQGWYNHNNNRGIVYNSGSAIAAMALLDELPEKCTEILNASYQFMQLPLHNFEPDGAWFEGVGYWSYTMQYIVSYMRSLETAFGTDFGLVDALRGKGFSKTGDFPIYLTSPQNGVFEFADANVGPGSFQHWSFYYLADRFDNPLYQYSQDKNGRGGLLDVVYRKDGGQDDFAAHEMPRDRHFRGMEIASMRSSWTDPNALFAGIKCGKNGISHSHQDLGSFILYGLGKRWFQDMGVERQAYYWYKHKVPTQDFYRIRAEGHNTLVLHPAAGPGQGKSALAKLIRFETSPSSVIAVADLSEVYGKYAVAVQRGYRLSQQRRQFLVQDEIQVAEPTDLWWFAHAAPKTEFALSENARKVTMRQGRALCNVYLLSPKRAVFQVLDARPLPSSPNPEIQNPNKDTRKLGINLSVDGSETIAVLMVPHFAHEAEQENELPAVSPFASWRLPKEIKGTLTVQVGGEGLENFSTKVADYTSYVPASQTGVPQVSTHSQDMQCEVLQATGIPGTAVIKVVDSQGTQAAYRIRFFTEAAKKVSTGGAHFRPKPVKIGAIRVSASSCDGNEPKFVLDGDPETRWSASGSKEWIAFEFENPRRIEALRIAWLNGHTRQSSFDIETSEDGKEWKNAGSFQSSGKTSDFETFSLTTPLQTSHIRIVGKGNNRNAWNSISEVKFTP